MSEDQKIPIKNIYYMICYAWNTLKIEDKTLVGIEKFDSIYNLLAKVIINGVNNIIKRGFHREYTDHKEELTMVRGKIDIMNSIRQQSLTRKRLVCDYDEFKSNVCFNQILKTTIGMIIRSHDLDDGLRKELIDIKYYFSQIDEIKINVRVFSLLKYSRNNIHYKMLMNVCELIYSGLITNESGNKFKFHDFIRDKQMEKLYEKFVLNFYKKHLRAEVYKVHSPKIKWDLDKNFNNIGMEYLPEMRTDVVIENELEHIQTIIDTKYYASALKSRNFSESKKLISDNLYQILAYLNNSNYLGTVSGILLYPTTEQELNIKYKINDKIIKVKTLNLSADWEEIYKRLINIINADENVC
ncbi:5-methylcytosine-specific restriction endonuclease system specificity protein McrC [Clostridiaceae bacterium UIB06]|uniref:5-methylcytosine-specific restriction endonuclease system specificity protein McrC n=1 Tax=Clostridium thailandense TaxID=2794346 RepID=A0A949TWG1_9CLOT|nr:5-methylcytosine-specific restriction endonuclease system specificity protein McrC [Clostridium thailandense]MBV7271649.1 5-methylcytosine-specific restriction endonuclease system specificity protein McrC [Clostridium thailandense]MCH5136380.1 5-methylcytosine-specific restriction endonuclease system specificity protein McrC [Clostridiaceae bacterium UIB06]